MASFEELRNTRIQKLAVLKEQGVNPYPIKTEKDVDLVEAISEFDKLSKRKKPLSLVGRVMSMRPQGGLIFFHFNDGTGQFQGLLKKGEVIEDKDFDLFFETVDVGDYVGVTGTVFVTKRGEKTIQVGSWRMLSKSLRPLPEKWHGLQDVEERYRRRYLDTLMNDEVKKRFITRSKIVSEVRSILDKEGFLEVETPVLHHIHGGASAEPFKTHHNALDIDLYLRIAPELYLKKLLIGGYPKVYEIGRLFRNEGIDATHNPEFTTVEFYESFADASIHMVFLEKMIKSLVKKVTGVSSFQFDGNKIDVSGKFKVISFLDLIERYALIPDPKNVSLEELSLKATQLGVRVEKGDPRHKIMDNIYKKQCRPKLIDPIFIIDYPLEFSPLAKRQEGNTAFIDRYQLVIGGYEVVNAFSELNDPLDQRDRFVEQEKNKVAGDAEAQPKDEDFLEALEYGMPPAAGVGLSIDRMTMLLTDVKNIREVILFPTLRQK